MRIGSIGTATALIVGAALAGCASDDAKVGAPVAGGRIATATLRTPAGEEVGRVRVTEVSGGLRVTIDARLMPPGMHGTHLHAIGRCEGPAFASAGPHWNPLGTKHGSMNPAGRHAGDLPNLVIGADGRGTIGVTIPGGSFDALLDADGAAMVVHAAADDMMTDPSGNSGARIACGVLVAG
ncbi:superoxide dismutase family protein [Sphingomonas sp.]|jgi:Cu-Zn family superoxide dismutase|uniref:superoxide dismutase family protein n=1 Tax=Sphingomonas sp. TaxID=28214 RepID=UPI002E3035E8|nr:superoxide dismutase family protein [Sphingomonas sp.]HEX4693106.1 superoxide dismutase family protein [Sphingomonas sp.]